MENHAGSYFHAEFLLWMNGTGRLLSRTSVWMGVHKMSSQQEFPYPQSQHCISQLFWAWCWAGFTPATPEPVSPVSCRIYPVWKWDWKATNWTPFSSKRSTVLALLLPFHWFICCISNPPCSWWFHPVHPEGQHLWIWFQAGQIIPF